MWPTDLQALTSSQPDNRFWKGQKGTLGEQEFLGPIDFGWNVFTELSKTWGKLKAREYWLKSAFPSSHLMTVFDSEIWERKHSKGRQEMQALRKEGDILFSYRKR